MRKLVVVIAVLGLGYLAFDRWSHDAPVGISSASADSVISDAFRNRQSNVQVEGQGEVIRMLADDTDGSRHQRFILRLASGQTLLVAHNIDLAPRLAQLKVGDTVEFSGEYEWNEQGGVIHWTHHDPSDQHRAGWLKYDGATYQ
jgi:hypothetical protein